MLLSSMSMNASSSLLVLTLTLAMIGGAGANRPVIQIKADGEELSSQAAHSNHNVVEMDAHEQEVLSQTAHSNRNVVEINAHEQELSSPTAEQHVSTSGGYCKRCEVKWLEKEVVRTTKFGKDIYGLERKSQPCGFIMWDGGAGKRFVQYRDDWKQKYAPVSDDAISATYADGKSTETGYLCEDLCRTYRPGLIRSISSLDQGPGAWEERTRYKDYSFNKFEETPTCKYEKSAGLGVHHAWQGSWFGTELLADVTPPERR
jgi:hypothetical protein